MFSKQERCKNKYKFGGIKVCKAEEIRKYFGNPKSESFRKLWKLHYFQFGFQIYRSSRSRMFFGKGALKNFAMLEFHFNKVAGLQSCTFIQKRLQHRCFNVKFAKFLRASFLSEHFWWLLLEMSLYHMRMMNCVIAWYVFALQPLFHFVACFISFYFFQFFLVF